MKLLIAILQDKDVAPLIHTLTEEKIPVTKLASTGGFLRQGNTTLILGIEEDQEEHVIAIMKKSSGASTLEKDGASVKVGTTVFVVPVEDFRKV